MTISDYLLAHEPDHCDRALHDLLAGRPNSTAAAGLWASIADGSASVPDTLAWAQHVARQISENVVNGDERDAAPAALKAIGFYGRVDAHRSARDYLDIVAAFPVLDGQGRPLPPARLPASRWLVLLRSAGHLTGLDDKTAVNKINAWRNELGIK